MQLPRVRHKVWTLMLGVAFSALFMSLVVHWYREAIRYEAIRKASHFRELDQRYAHLKLVSHELIREIEVALLTRRDYPCSEMDLRLVKQHQEDAAYYAALAAKYEEAARHPLSSVAPDPPPPARVPGLSQPEGMKLINTKVDPSEVLRLINRWVDPSKRVDSDERAE